MKKRYCSILLIFALISSSQAIAESARKSTIDDQTDVEVTVYNSNLALIKDTRMIKLEKGEGELRLMDVASHINPVTVHIKSKNNPNDFMVLEQNYEYDLMDQNKLLDKYVGKKVKLLDYNRYQDRKEIIEAELLSNNNYQPIYKIEDEIYLGHPGTQILPGIPENLIAKPTLMWMYNNATKGPHELEVSYLTGAMTWRADYVIVLNKDDTKADLSGWVTVDNKSGTEYKQASLKLVAGEINRAQEERYGRGGRKAVMMEGLAYDAPQFEEKGFFEYHIYDLQRRTTLKNNQTKQISLLEAADFIIEKEYLVYGEKTYYTRQYREDNPKQPVNVNIKFKNTKENNLGIPLPKGIMRLYKKDDEDKLQLVGEDRIEHTPKDEEVKLKVGEAFDIVAERRQTDFRQLTTRMYETEWEVTLKNHKEEAVTVGIIEPVYGNWSVISNNHSFQKVDAFTLRFDVDVPQDETVKVIYRLRIGI